MLTTSFKFQNWNNLKIKYDSRLLWQLFLHDLTTSYQFFPFINFVVFANAYFAVSFFSGGWCDIKCDSTTSSLSRSYAKYMQKLLTYEDVF